MATTTKSKPKKEKDAHLIPLEEILARTAGTRRPLLLDIDPRIDLTKPIYEQVMKLEAKDAKAEAKAQATSSCGMTAGLLLDTHVLLWLDEQTSLPDGLRTQFNAARRAKTFFRSDISIWEIGVAVHKKSLERRPDLRGLSVEQWFDSLASLLAIRTLRISREIAVEAAKVPAVYGSGDPGDCFLIATARIHQLTLVTRDSKMIDLAKRKPDYLRVLPF